uniref:uncharacterized protein LOC122601677 n=1 Tax=Erigeron canadensis TaxID=72917 RepID=UPI001CB900EF|nr:uncharacterized protein LOC122601677 [Erigeron canadensis]
MEHRDNLGWNWNWCRPIRTNHEEHMVSELMNLIPARLDNNSKDGWVWNLKGKLHFSVSQLRQLIDHYCLPTDSNVKTRWNTLVLKKFNIFVWKLCRDRIPTNVNFFIIGIDVSTVRCHLCQDGIDETDHIFQNCKKAVETRKLLCAWTRLDFPADKPAEVINWCDKIDKSDSMKRRVEAILFIWWWYLWKNRNNSFHNNAQESSLETFNAIVALAFLWIKNRDRKVTLSWETWIDQPFQ